MAFPYIAALQTLGGLYGAYENRRAQKEQQKQTRRTKKKLIRQSDALLDKQERNAISTSRADTAARNEIIQSLVREKGLEGSSFGLEAIARGDSDSAKMLNDRIGTIDENRLRSRLNISSQFRQEPEPGPGPIAGELLGSGLEGVFDYIDGDDNGGDDSFQALFESYFGKRNKKKTTKVSKEQVLKLLNDNPEFRDQFRL